MTDHATTARLLGYWKASLREAYALPQHFEAVLDPDVRTRLVRYLDGGALVNQFRGHSQCRYGCGENGSAERTDVEWVWPEGLSHYVAVHGVGLPQAFIDHVGSRAALPPADRIVAGSRIHADETDWLRWSAERMPAAFKSALERAITAADSCIAVRVDATAGETEARLGLSDARCMRSGCERRACHDRALCGRCLTAAAGTEEAIRQECDREQLRALLDELHVSANPRTLVPSRPTTI